MTRVAHTSFADALWVSWYVLLNVTSSPRNSRRNAASPLASADEYVRLTSEYENGVGALLGCGLGRGVVGARDGASAPGVGEGVVGAPRGWVGADDASAADGARGWVECVRGQI